MWTLSTQNTSKYKKRNETVLSHIGRLWTGSVELQIELMKQIHDSFKEEEKPQWLTIEQIMEYGRRMKS